MLKWKISRDFKVLFISSLVFVMLLTGAVSAASTDNAWWLNPEIIVEDVGFDGTTYTYKIRFDVTYSDCYCDNEDNEQHFMEWWFDENYLEKNICTECASFDAGNCEGSNPGTKKDDIEITKIHFIGYVSQWCIDEGYNCTEGCPPWEPNCDRSHPGCYDWRGDYVNDCRSPGVVKFVSYYKTFTFDNPGEHTIQMKIGGSRNNCGKNGYAHYTTSFTINTNNYIFCGNNNIDAGEECDDGNNQEGDGCSSVCKIEEILCYNNEECGINYWLNQDYCESESEVWDYQTTYTCENSGTYESYCNESDEILLKQNCGSDYCENWSYNCQNGDVYKNRDCYNKGCSSGGCLNSFYKESELLKECVYGCKDGECTEPPACLTDENCQEDYYSDNYCQDNSAYHDFHDFSCQQGACTENIFKKLIEECTDWYAAGECEGPLCCDGSDCGTNGFVGEKFCQGKEIYQDYETFVCENPGATNASCNSSTALTFLKECNYRCKNGECIGKKPKEEKEKNYCGDNFCDITNGEDELNCYEDCKPVEKSTSSADSEEDMQKETVRLERLAVGNTTEDSKKTNSFILFLFLILSIILILFILILSVFKR